MLSTTDSTDDPEESWSHIEQEMQRLLTTVESLQQPNKIVDIERKLLGVVLKEDNIEKIEQIREECSGKGIRVNTTVVQNEPINGQIGKEQLSMNENKQIGKKQKLYGDTVEIGNGAKECCEKEIQVNTMDGKPLKQVRRVC